MRFVILLAVACLWLQPARAQQGIVTNGCVVSNGCPLPVTTPGANGQPVSPTNPAPTYDAPTSSPAAGIVPIVSGPTASSLVLKASPGNLYSATAVSTVSGTLVLFNATSAPGNGAYTFGTASGNAVLCGPISANSPPNGPAFPGLPPAVFSVGIVAVFSSSACGTLTLSATALLTGFAQ